MGNVKKNHLFQVLTLLNKKRSVSFNPRAVKDEDEKGKFLRACEDVKRIKILLIGRENNSRTAKIHDFLDEKTFGGVSMCVTYMAFGLCSVEEMIWRSVCFKCVKILYKSERKVRFQFLIIAYLYNPRKYRSMYWSSISILGRLINPEISGIFIATSVNESDMTCHNLEKT